MGRRKKASAVVDPVDDIAFDVAEVVAESPVDLTGFVHPPDIKIVWIPTGNVQTHELNPNVQRDETFNYLVEEIERWGFDEPILVCPIGVWDGTTEDRSGKKIVVGDTKFRIVAGEHRYKALRVQGWEILPCIVKEWDEYWQKIELVRRNQMRGEFDPAKFGRLVKDLQGEHDVSITDLPTEMGFTSAKEFGKFLKSEEKKAASKEAISDKGDAESAVENLAWVLNEVMSEAGDTVPQGYVFFMHKKKMHLLVNMDDTLETVIKRLTNKLGDTKENIRSFLSAAIMDNLPDEDTHEPDEDDIFLDNDDE